MNRFKLARAGVNTTEGLKRFDEDEDMYEEVLNGFVKDTNYAILCEAITAKDLKTAFKAAHSLKGVAGNLSMTRLYDDIFPLVEELRAESLEHSKELLKAVTEDYEAVMKVLTKS